jgi:hypothetical protein
VVAERARDVQQYVSAGRTEELPRDQERSPRAGSGRGQGSTGCIR